MKTNLQKVAMWTISSLCLTMLLFVINCNSFTAHLQKEQQNYSTPAGWQRIELQPLSFYLPPDMQSESVSGIDSSVWAFHNESSRLVIDLGLHSNDLSTYEDWPDFHTETARIDSRSAKICTFRHSNDFIDSADADRLFIAAVHFSDIGKGKNGLTFWISSKTPQQQQAAKTIFYSIRFK